MDLLRFFNFSRDAEAHWGKMEGDAKKQLRVILLFLLIPDAGS
jgi:hypothetical protein